MCGIRSITHTPVQPDASPLPSGSYATRNREHREWRETIHAPSRTGWPRGLLAALIPESALCIPCTHGMATRGANGRPGHRSTVQQPFWYCFLRAMVHGAAMEAHARQHQRCRWRSRGGSTGGRKRQRRRLGWREGWVRGRAGSGALEEAAAAQSAARSVDGRRARRRCARRHAW